MRILITADLEGASDVVAIEEIFRKFPQEYALARERMIADTAALCAGIMKAAPGAGIVVHDYHGDNRNIDHDRLPTPVELVRGRSNPPWEEDFDLYMMVGIHARYGTRGGVICHTYTGNIELAINNQPMGEFELLAGWAGERGVPTVLVSGGAAAVAQARNLVPEMTGVVTKFDLDSRAARCRHPREVREELHRAAAEAIAGRAKIPPLRFTPPLLMRITMTRAFIADQVDWVPGVRRIDARSLEYEARSMEECHRMLAGIARIRIPN